MRCIDVCPAYETAECEKLKKPPYVMDALKKAIVSCQECFILPSMLMMNIAVCLLIAELVSIRLESIQSMSNLLVPLIRG